MFITPGPPETYRTRNGFTSRVISSGPSGQEVAILSIDADKSSSSFDISIWLNRFGMTCVGGTTFEIANCMPLSSESEVDIVWHAMGSALCSIAYGDVLFIKISWMNKSTKAPVLFTDATNIYNISTATDHSSNSFTGDVVAVKLSNKIRYSVDATAICSADSGRYLLVASKQGTIYRFSWLGVKVSQIIPDSSNDVYNTWQRGASFAFIKAQYQVHSSNEGTLDNFFASSSGAETEQKECSSIVDNLIPASKMISCEYNNSLQLYLFVRKDGSIYFLQDVDCFTEHPKLQSSPISGYRCSSNIHPAVLLKLDTEGGNNKLAQNNFSVLSDFQPVDIDQSFLSGVCQAAVSRVTHACFVQSENDVTPIREFSIDQLGEDYSALVLMIIETRQSQQQEQHKEEKKNLASPPHITNKLERVTLTLSMMKVTIQSNPLLNDDAILLEQVSAITLESSRVSSQLTTTPTATTSPDFSDPHTAHNLSILRRPGQTTDLVLVTIKGVISCRTLGCLGSELFRIDVQSHTHTAGVRNTVSAMSSSFGRLLLAVDYFTDSDSVDGICTASRSRIHMIPLLECAESNIFQKNCGDILIDGVEQRLLIFNMLWNQGSGSAPGPGVQGGLGNFGELSLPPGLQQEWRARLHYISVQNVRGKREGGGGILVASSLCEGSGAHSVKNILSRKCVSHIGSASAGKGYLAVVVGGRSSGKVEPCLWLYNSLTGRWRSCEINIKTKTEAGVVEFKGPQSIASTRRSSVDMGSGLWVEVGVKSEAHTSVQLALEHVRRQSSTDSEGSTFSKYDSKALPYGMNGHTRSPSFNGSTVTAASISPPTASSILSLSWFGDHSLILLRRRDTMPYGTGGLGSPKSATSSCSASATSSFFIEILSRAATKQSLRTGRPRPAVHRVLPLSQYPPSSLNSDSPADSAPRILEVRYDENWDGERCVVVISNGWSCVGYSVEAVLSPPGSGEIYVADFVITVMWDLNFAGISRNVRNVSQSLAGIFPTNHSDNGHNSNGSSSSSRGRRCTITQVSLPISVLNILPTAFSGVSSLLLLDRLGIAWKLNPQDPQGGYSLISPGPFRAVSNFNFNTLFSPTSPPKSFSKYGKILSERISEKMSSENLENSMDPGSDSTEFNGQGCTYDRSSEFDVAVVLHSISYSANNSEGTSSTSSSSSSSGSNNNNNNINNNNNNNINNNNNNNNNNHISSSSSSSSSGNSHSDYLWLASTSAVADAPTMSHRERGGAGGGAVSTDSVRTGLQEALSFLIPLRDSRPNTANKSGTTQVSMTVCVVKGMLLTMERSNASLPIPSTPPPFSFSSARDHLATEAGGVGVRSNSLGYHAFLGLIEVATGRIQPEGVSNSSGNAFQIQIEEDRKEAAVCLIRRMLTSLHGPNYSPCALRQFTESVELQIKKLLESSTFSSATKTNRWVRLNAPLPSAPTPAPRSSLTSFITGKERYSEIMSALYYCSQPIASSSVLVELISCLGRKLEPSLSKRLFPVPLDPRVFPPNLPHTSIGSIGHPSTTQSPPGPTPLQIFEHTLSTRQLNRCCRLLTLACEDVGGTDSGLAASRCLQMALELFYECARHLSLPMAVQCFDFCHRLETMIASINLAATVGPGTRSGIRTDPGSGSGITSVAVGRGVTVGEPQTQTRGQRRIERSPELQVACGGNAIWQGVGGGVFSSLASVSPALSYYIGGTMIWAVAQTIRLLSDGAPVSPVAREASRGGREDPVQRDPGPSSTYTYTVLTALTHPINAHTRTSNCSPSMALLTLLCRDVLACGRYHCCAVLMAGMLASKTSPLKDHLKQRILDLFLTEKSANNDSNDSNKEEKIMSGKETALAVAKAFKLRKMIISEGRKDQTSAQLLSGKLSKSFQVSYLRQKCEREMLALGSLPSSLHDDKAVQHTQTHTQHSCTTLVISDVTTTVLTQAYSYRNTSRVLFLTAAELAAQAIRQQDSLDESDQADLDLCVTTLLTAPSLSSSCIPIVRAQSTLRVLPQALHAVSSIDIGPLSVLHARTDGTGPGTDPRNPGYSSFRGLIQSLCVGFLLTGDADSAGAVTSLLLGRPDVEVACKVLHACSTSSATATSSSSPSATSTPGAGVAFEVSPTATTPTPASADPTSTSTSRDGPEVTRQDDEAHQSTVTSAVDTVLSFLLN